MTDARGANSRTEREIRERPLANLRVVLVSPQTAENVGAVARVMANFGCNELVVVDARCDVSAEGPAGKLAVDYGKPILAAARAAATLDEALADVHASIALTMQASDDRPVEFRGYVPAPLLVATPAEARLALVFGREDRGMSNEECKRCTFRWSVPTAPEAPSLNLAQAAAIAFAGLAEAIAAAGPPRQVRGTATQKEVEGMLDHVVEMLHAVDYERGVPLEHSMSLVRRVALRAQLDADEVRHLRGICRRIMNAMRIAKAGMKDEG